MNGSNEIHIHKQPQIYFNFSYNFLWFYIKKLHQWNEKAEEEKIVGKTKNERIHTRNSKSLSQENARRDQNQKEQQQKKENH